MPRVNGRIVRQRENPFLYGMDECFVISAWKVSTAYGSSKKGVTGENADRCLVGGTTEAVSGRRKNGDYLLADDDSVTVIQKTIRRWRSFDLETVHARLVAGLVQHGGIQTGNHQRRTGSFDHLIVGSCVIEVRMCYQNRHCLPGPLLEFFQDPRSVSSRIYYRRFSGLFISNYKTV